MTASNVISGEPLPERAILIEKFEPAVFRSGIDQKKVHFKCNNGKIWISVTYSRLWNYWKRVLPIETKFDKKKAW